MRPGRTQTRRRTIGARMGGLAMANVTYHPQSFSVLFWQHVINVNAPLIPVPVGAVSGSLGGFAFENVDGTYTVFLGSDIVLGDGAPISGTVMEIVRRSTLDPFGIHYADITGSFPATGVHEAFLAGGSDFFHIVLFGNDVVEIESPASLGPLSQSPLIETDEGDDVVLGSIYADTIYAGGGVDRVEGDRGDDTIYGGGGNDLLLGDRGDDTLFGQDGNDFLMGFDGQDIILGGEGDDIVSGGDGVDLISGGTGNDELHGDDGGDAIWGDSGGDDIYGEDGNDTILGGDGNDDLYGGSGRDEIVGGDGDDYIEGAAGVDTLSGGRGLDEIWGGDGGDFIYGGDHRDILRGNDGDDSLWGEEGNDLIWAGNGDDTIDGGPGLDHAFYNRPLAAYESRDQRRRLRGGHRPRGRRRSRLSDGHRAARFQRRRDRRLSGGAVRVTAGCQLRVIHVRFSSEPWSARVSCALVATEIVPWCNTTPWARKRSVHSSIEHDYSITSSARNSSDVGIVSPSA
jgi:Ca2+-binding RTX toxin-like protein